MALSLGCCIGITGETRALLPSSGPTNESESRRLSLQPDSHPSRAAGRRDCRHEADDAPRSVSCTGMLYLALQRLLSGGSLRRGFSKLVDRCQSDAGSSTDPCLACSRSRSVGPARGRQIRCRGSAKTTTEPNDYQVARLVEI